MGVKKLKPTSPGRRFQTVSDFETITKSKPEKSLLAKQKRSSGRNARGRITSRHSGGGHKRRYRVIDFRRTKDGIPAKVAAIEYDPNRNARIALLHYVDGEKRYILAPQGLQVGQKLVASESADIVVGNCLPIRNIPLGTMVHNVELKIGKGGQMVRSAGTAAQVLAKAGKPMRAQELITAMAEQGLWSSPAGKTPHATLYAAMLRESRDKGTASRFKKVDRGQFEYNG